MKGPLPLLTRAAAAGKVRPRDVKAFELDGSGVELAHALSLTDWREWWPMVEAPFEQTWMEWSTSSYAGLSVDRDTGEAVKAPDVDDPATLGVLVRETSVALYVATAGDVRRLPFHIDLVGTSLPEDIAAKAFASMPVDVAHAVAATAADLKSTLAVQLFGPAYVRAHGAPPCSTLPDFANTPETIEALTRRFAALRALSMEMAGCLRVVCAAVALLNVERENQVVTPLRPAGRVMLRNRPAPMWKPRRLVLRPDAPRLVVQRAEEREREASRRREHDFAERATCTHEDQERGGVEWTRCTQCGQRWSDRDGGPPAPGAEPEVFNRVRAALRALEDPA